MSFERPAASLHLPIGTLSRIVKDCRGQSPGEDGSVEKIGADLPDLPGLALSWRQWHQVQPRHKKGRRSRISDMCSMCSMCSWNDRLTPSTPSTPSTLLQKCAEWESLASPAKGKPSQARLQATSFSIFGLFHMVSSIAGSNCNFAIWQRMLCFRKYSPSIL